MKSKFSLFSAIFQIVVGSLAILAFVVIAIDGENMIRWIVTLLLAIAYVVTGAIGIIDYKRK